MSTFISERIHELRLQPQAVLDIGCGKGSLLQALAHRFPDAELYGVDPSARAVKTASRRLGGRARIKQAGAETLPLPDVSVDLAIARLTFHHWSDKQQGLREVARVLRPGGYLIMQDPLTQGWLQRRWFRRLAEAIDGGRFTETSELETMLTTAGLDLVSIHPLPGHAHMVHLITITKPKV